MGGSAGPEQRAQLLTRVQEAVRRRTGAEQQHFQLLGTATLRTDQLLGEQLELGARARRLREERERRREALRRAEEQLERERRLRHRLEAQLIASPAAGSARPRQMPEPDSPP